MTLWDLGGAWVLLDLGTFGWRGDCVGLEMWDGGMLEFRGGIEG